MKIKEITESLSPNTDFKAINGQKSAIPGNGPVPQFDKRKKKAKQEVEILLKK